MKYCFYFSFSGKETMPLAFLYIQGTHDPATHIGNSTKNSQKVYIYCNFPTYVPMTKFNLQTSHSKRLRTKLVLK